MPEQRPLLEQQPLASVETPEQLVARVVEGEALKPLERAALAGALKRLRVKQRKAARAAQVEMPPTWGTLNTSR